MSIVARLNPLAPAVPGLGYVATQPQAVAGTDNAATMTALRVAQTVVARGAPPVGSVRRGQFLRALEASGAGRVASLQIPADPGSAANIAWTHEPFVTPGGTLATLVQATFSLSSSDMTALFTAASAVSL